ncbi:MAG TPA: PPOX class F420-dependent oxidoreductase [Acidimicrobiia bacterium]|nr:PPOX class F420-dependent oxidoreductase [Acidimicrobiia bacterium]
MSRERAMEFLSADARTGSVATVGEDGRPHVVPIWYIVEGDEVVFTTWHNSVKARNLASNGRAAMTIDDEDPPFSYLMVEGPVTISDDPAESRRVATLAGGKYMGDARADEFGARNGVTGELVVRLRIEHLVGADEVAG